MQGRLVGCLGVEGEGGVSNGASVLASGVVDPSDRGRKQGRGKEEAGVGPAVSQEQGPTTTMTFAFCSEDDVVGAERVQDRGLGGGIWHCCLRDTSRTPAGPQEGPLGAGVHTGVAFIPQKLILGRGGSDVFSADRPVLRAPPCRAARGSGQPHPWRLADNSKRHVTACQVSEAGELGGTPEAGWGLGWAFPTPST